MVPASRSETARPLIYFKGPPRFLLIPENRQTFREIGPSLSTPDYLAGFCMISATTGLYTWHLVESGRFRAHYSHRPGC